MKQNKPFTNKWVWQLKIIPSLLLLLPLSISDLHSQSVVGLAVPADIELHSQAGHCDDSRSAVMGSDRRFIPRSCDRNTLHSPLLRVLTPVCVCVCETHAIQTVPYECDRSGMCM